MPSPLFVTWTVVVALGSVPSEDAGPRPVTQEADEARTFHLSDAVGTFAKPRVLSDLAALAKVCGAFQSPAPREDQNAYQRGVERAGRTKIKQEVRRQVFQADFEAPGFRFDDYDVKRQALPLDLEKPLVSWDGGLSLSVSDRSGAHFALPDHEAEDVARRHQEKRLKLRVTFTFDDDRDEHEGGCYGHPKADAFTVLAYPLAFELLGEKDASLARARTPRLERFRSWLEPGVATVRVEVLRQTGTLDEVALKDAVESQRPALEACVAQIKSSAAGTGMAAINLSALPNGTLADTSVELDAYDDPQVVPCLQKTLTAVTVKKAPKPSRLQVLVAVDRGS
ncbi:MAG: hypothetical protein IPG45_09510 [Deltaproteobacteria bacterium]|nr:hypothetical protein [Deltaproteobacteria bacterium]